MCVFLGGQSDTEHFSRALVTGRWAYGSDGFGEDIGNTSSLSNHGFHKWPRAHRWQSHSQQAHPGAVWLLLACSAPAPSAPPSQVISWAPSLHHFCACVLPAQDDPPDSVHLEFGEQKGREVIPLPPGMSLIAPFTCH